jgi:hypothetical protein
MGTTNARCLMAVAMASALLATGLVPTTQAWAKDSWGIVNYEMLLPTSDTGDFVDGTSFRGFGVEGRWFTNRNTSVGYSLDWNVLHESTDRAIVKNNVTLSGMQDRTINTFPFLVTAHRYMGPQNMFFAGLGGGFYYEEQRLDIGIFSFDSEMWHLGVAPEIGVSYEIDYDVRAVLALRYNYGFEKSDSTLTYWTLKVGIGW